MTTFCTICARNYMAHVRVLARSIHKHHEDAEVYALVVDDESWSLGTGEADFSIVRPRDIGLSQREFHKMATIYGVVELSTSMKPWLLRTLLQRTRSPVIYLDPDVEIFSSIADLIDLAAEHDIVLTPHTLAPMKRDGLAPAEPYMLQAGAFNLGFIAVGPGSSPFLDWWGERLRRDCIIDVAAGYFVDQRWMDLVPGYFNHHILRSPCFNVAYWNADQRPLTWAGYRYEIEGEPLRFFHYSGFDPERPDELCKYFDSPRLRLNEHPALARLCRHYTNRLVSMGYLQCAEVPYVFDYSAGGLRLDHVIRKLYRKSIISADKGECDPPPNPYEPYYQSDAFVEWLLERPNPDRPCLSRYLEGLYDARLDLRGAFPNVSGVQGQRFVDWARTHGSIPSMLIDHASITRKAVPTAPSQPLEEGVNVVGYVFAESGVGQSARLLIETLKQAGTPYSVLPLRRAPNRQNSEFWDRGRGVPVFDTNIVCVNADELPHFVEDGGRELLDGRYTIGIWAWEVEEFPERFRASADFVDEVWVYSDHAKQAIARVISKPVHVFPLPVERPGVAAKTRQELGLPDGFLFLFCFDFYSVFERKNPLALVDAFVTAFEPGAGPSLVIKSVNGDVMPSQLEALRTRAANRPDINILDGYLDEADQHALMAACDAYVSLHRAEGYGLTIAEAMALGKPIIATAYSGNLEFMNDENSFMVPYTKVPIPEGCDPYISGGPWAEPDIDAAARMMRGVFLDPTSSQTRGARAARDMEALHSPRSRSSMVLKRMEAIKRRSEITGRGAVELRSKSGSRT